MPPDEPAYRLRRLWLHADEAKGAIEPMPSRYCGPCVTSPWPESFTKGLLAFLSGNARFAERVFDELRMRPGLVWVTFRRTPWSAADAFRILPERRELTESLLAADLVTFQTCGNPYDEEGWPIRPD